MKLARLLIIIFFLLINSVCFAFSLQLNPIKINFAPQQQITSMQITNKDTQSVILQLSIKQWKQDKKGKDIYTNTNDLLVTPPIFTLGPGQTQIVRLAIMKPMNLSSEQTYRLIVREVAQKQASNGKNQLHLVMQFILPVFVDPVKVQTTSLRYVLSPAKNHKQTVVVENQSNHHVVVTSVILKDKNGKTVGGLDKLGQYVLSHGQSQFIVPVQKGETASKAVIQSIG